MAALSFGRREALTTALFGSGGTAQFSFAIPSTPVLLGAQFFTQGASFDPAANALGFVTSDAAAFVIGQ